MIEYKETETVQKKYEPTKVICDVCKKEYPCDDIMETQEFQHIRFIGGYGSVFGDEEAVELDICQHCLKDKLGEYFRYLDD